MPAEIFWGRTETHYFCKDDGGQGEPSGELMVADMRNRVVYICQMRNYTFDICFDICQVIYDTLDIHVVRDFYVVYIHISICLL